MVLIFRFNVYRPRSLDDALEILDREAPEVIPIAGGTDVLVLAREDVIKFKGLIDLWPLRRELSFVRREDGFIRIGALTTINELGRSFLVNDVRYLGFHDLIHYFATPYIRNLATVGGNIATAHPLSDAAILLLTLNAELKLVSVKGERWVSLENLYAGKRVLRKEPNELITEVRFREKPVNSSTSLLKFDRRKAHIMGYVVVATYAYMDHEVIKDVAIAFDSVGKPYPGRAKLVEEFLKGKSLTNDVLSRAVKEVLIKEMTRISDYRATSDYRLYLSGVLLKRSLLKVKERIQRGSLG